jgi:quercetin dioxygenase-like cupin family protein
MKDTEVKVSKWEGVNLPTRSEIEKRLTSENLNATSWSNGPGDRYSTHAHTFDKVIYVVEGEITFELPETGEEFSLQVGDRMDLPAHTPHAAVVGSAGVLCLEAHI